MPIDPDELLAGLHTPGAHDARVPGASARDEVMTDRPLRERDRPEHPIPDRGRPRPERSEPPPVSDHADRIDTGPERNHLADPPAEPTRIRFTDDGPALVDGPVELVTADGDTIRSDRFLVAICLCKRSRTYPLCDTSHRRRRRPNGDRTAPTD